jgi:hypothetical protein
MSEHLFILLRVGWADEAPTQLERAHTPLRSKAAAYKELRKLGFAEGFRAVLVRPEGDLRMVNPKGEIVILPEQHEITLLVRQAQQRCPRFQALA